MKKKIVTLVFSCFFCCFGLSLAETQTPPSQTQKENAEAALAQIPNSWQQTQISETVFGSNVFIVEHGSSNNPPVVLVHGLGQIGLMTWEHLIPSLAENYHLIALDLPGFGRSQSRQGRYSPSNYAKVIDQITAALTSQPFTLIGHSMGGAVALRYAAMHPQKVHRLVLVDAAGILERTAFLKESTSLSANKIDIPGSNIGRGVKDFLSNLAVTVVNKFSGTPEILEWLSRVDLLWGKTFSGKSNLNAAMSLVDEDFSDAVFAYDNKVHIIWGGKDTIAPLRTGKVLDRQLENSELHILPNAGHVPMFTHKQEFHQLIKNILTDNHNSNDFAANNRSYDLTCNNDTGKVYTGIFNTVTLKNCSDIVFTQLYAKNLELVNSHLKMEDSVINASDIAVEMENSTMVATNSDFYGKAAFQLSNSSIDLAGSLVQAEYPSVKSSTKSFAIFSISQLHSSGYKGKLHGRYVLENQTLDSLLK